MPHRITYFPKTAKPELTARAKMLKMPAHLLADIKGKDKHRVFRIRKRKELAAIMEAYRAYERLSAYCPDPELSSTLGDTLKTLIASHTDNNWMARTKELNGDDLPAL